MRTLKAVLCLSALAAGIATSVAQSNVYSLNVVGYVNVPLKGGANFSMIANPLNNANNNITNLFPTASDGDQLYRWDAVAQDFSGTINSYFAGSGWDSNFELKPGEAVFFLNSGADRTATFVGEVLQGAYTNPQTIVGGASFNALGSSVPLGGSFTNAIVGLPLSDGDQIYTWDTTTQDLGGVIASYFTGSGWDTTAVTINPGIGFFYLNSGANKTWSRTFNVQ